MGLSASRFETRVRGFRRHMQGFDKLASSAAKLAHKRMHHGAETVGLV